MITVKLVDNDSGRMMARTIEIMGGTGLDFDSALALAKTERTANWRTAGHGPPIEAYICRAQLNMKELTR